MKKYIMIIAFVFLIILVGCSAEDLQPTDLIESPENNTSPLSGKWVVEKSIDGPYLRGSTEKIENTNDIEALFHKTGVVLGGDFILNPSYKIRNVDIKDYLFYNYKIDLSYLNIEVEMSEIITVYGEEGYFNEFIKYKEDEMIVFYNDKFLILKKQIDQVNEEEIKRYINIEKSIKRNVNKEEGYSLNSGVLLGIKTKYYDEEMKIDNWDYNTIWIRTSNRKISNIYKVEGLLVPRKREFWKIDVIREEINKNTRDIILAKEMKKFKEEPLSNLSEQFDTAFSNRILDKYISLLKNILYVGNDYISVEEINLGMDKKSLRVYPIDYLQGSSILISDLLGKEGKKEFYESAKSNIKLGEENLIEEKNFGIDRRNGHWIMKGRINYKDKQSGIYKDFNIKAIPPNELVHYDELVVNWNLIKSIFPDAIDAFTSPNEDIIVIVTREDISVYPIIDGDISVDKLGKIELNRSQSVVMAEWGIGKYSGLWEDEIFKNGGIELEY